MMAHPYFQAEPPKSTGRELFGHNYAVSFLEQARLRSLSDEDTMATATAFTAHSIADSYVNYVFPHHRMDEVIVTGGGAHNKTLLLMLRELLPEQKVMTSKALGFDDDAKEAVILRCWAMTSCSAFLTICQRQPGRTSRPLWEAGAAINHSLNPANGRAKRGRIDNVRQRFGGK